MLSMDLAGNKTDWHRQFIRSVCLISPPFSLINARVLGAGSLARSDSTILGDISRAIPFFLFSERTSLRRGWQNQEAL